MAHSINGFTFPDYNDNCLTRWSDLHFVCVGIEKVFDGNDYKTFVSLRNDEHNVEMKVLIKDITCINGKDYNKTTGVSL